ncbi:hypothetical protein [Mucilaginibacter antarcticus]|uniref:hypothetical protein n=1 Tax=Mucilaginibacter antarcticus TaxID=1855725 RepID=UPI00363A6FBF
MKTLIIIAACLLAFVANAQDKMNKFHIVDSLTEKPMPQTSVTIVRAKLSIATEKDGVFIIPGDLSNMQDTVILNSQNYRQLKIPIYLMDGMDTIRLSKFVIEHFDEKLKFDNDTLLNDYNRKDVVHYAGINTRTANFDYLQMAQQFYIAKPGTTLKSITLNRLAFGLDLSGLTWSGMVRMDKTKFRIRVYAIDPVTKGPGRDLCNQVIEEDESVGRQVNINLKKYNIHIPDTTFFVAIEWIRDFYNAGFSLGYDPKTNRPKKKTTTGLPWAYPEQPATS